MSKVQAYLEWLEGLLRTGGGGKAASKGAKKRSSYVSVDGFGYARSPPRMRTSPLGRSFAIGLAWLSEKGLPDVDVGSPPAPGSAGRST